VALVAGLLSITEASARTIYACVPKSGSAHVYTKKTKCKSHETALSWTSSAPAGPEGLQGPQGLAGPTGAAGAAGKGVTGGAGPTGHIGVTGNTGPSGTAEVTERPAAGVKETTGTELGAETAESTVECVGSERLVGGGAQTSVTSSGTDPVPAIVQSYPSGKSWIAEAAVLKAGAEGSKIAVQAYALCGK
jgi:hypothetical protein